MCHRAPNTPTDRNLRVGIRFVVDCLESPTDLYLRTLRYTPELYIYYFSFFFDGLCVYVVVKVLQRHKMAAMTTLKLSNRCT
jgi:hypothetical protein